MLELLFIGLRYVIDKYIIVITPFILSFIILLYVSSHNLEKFLIENIKSSLPEYYIYYYGDLKALIKGTQHFKGGFNYSFSGLKLKIKDEEILLNDVILNVFNEKNIPYILKKFEKFINEKDKIVFLDTKSYIDLGKPKFIDILSYNNKYVKLKVFRVDLFLNKSIIIMPYYLAKEVIPLKYSSNIVIIKSNLDEATLKKLYKEKYKIDIKTWKENIPFFFRYIYEISSFSISSLLISVLVFLGLSMYIIYENTSYILKRITKIYTIYGFSIIKNLIYNILVVSVVLIYTLLASFMLFKAEFWFLNKVTPHIFITSNNPEIFFTYIVAYIFIVVTTFISVYEWRKRPLDGK